MKEFRTPKTSSLDVLDIRAAGSTRKRSALGSSSSAPWLLSGEMMVPMKSIQLNYSTQTLPIFSSEVNRVLGGGLVKGSVILLAGEPGIGKSTLLLQLASSVVQDCKGKVVYLSGEENSEQIAARAKRLQLNTDDIFLICDIDADEAISNILNIDGDGPPSLVIVDSIQTMRTSSCTSSMGSVTQTRESAARFVQLAKSTGSSVLLVGHVTKSGEVAGPRILEHMVDVVLYLEGSERAEFRLLRGIKNRFGSTSEVGVLSMTEEGMKDVNNPSELFLTDGVAEHGQEGSAVAVLLEGTRPLLAEVQCLVSAASPRANVKRMSDGFPVQRLLLICAVIEKRLKMQLWNRDVYINIAGGLRVTEPASDLAVAITVISSLSDRSIKAGAAFIGEVGLGGELRSAKGLEQRVKEAAKLGFKLIVVPKSGLKGLHVPSLKLSSDCKVVGCSDLKEVMDLVLVGYNPAAAIGKSTSPGAVPFSTSSIPSMRSHSYGSSDFGPGLVEEDEDPYSSNDSKYESYGDSDNKYREEDKEEEEEDSARYRVPQFYSPGEDLRREDAAAAAKASRYKRKEKRK